VVLVPSLFVIRGNDQGSRYELEEPALGIGRDPSNPIQLHDTEVSRRHAELRMIEKAYALIDLGSSNGTFVNNRRVQQHTLESGDEVKIGSTVMLYKGPGDESGSLVDKIDIISQKRDEEDASKIVQALSQNEGSSLLTASDVNQSPWMRQAMSNLEVMYRTALAVSHTLDIDQLLSRIMQLIFEWVEADRGCILLVNNDTKKLDRKAVRFRRGVNEKEKLRLSNTIIEYVMKKGQGVLTSDAQEDSRWNPAASILQHNVREAICVPMQGRHNNMVGLIYVDTSTPPERIITHGSVNKFNEDHLKLMIAIGHQAAMAVEDTRYYGELMQAERLAAVGQTIATLSHHIKNILQGIRGGSYVIEMGLSEQEKQSKEATPDQAAILKATTTIRKGWDMVDKNQNKISALVMDMLTFSKEREPDLSSADLNQVGADVAELMEQRAKEHSVHLKWQPAKVMPTLVFDPEGLHRAILNVVTNALDACANTEDRQGVVKISTEFYPAEAIARVIIEDNGSGIPPEDIEKIFILFNSSKKGGRGTGLGLSVSNKILHEHGGRIDVESKVGTGSRFILQFPAVYPEEAPEEPGDPDVRATSPSKGPGPKGDVQPQTLAGGPVRQTPSHHTPQSPAPPHITPPVGTDALEHDIETQPKPPPAKRTQLTPKKKPLD